MATLKQYDAHVRVLRELQKEVERKRRARYRIEQNHQDGRPSVDRPPSNCPLPHSDDPLLEQLKAKRAEEIPTAAFGPGARLDAKTNTLYGADGHVYTDLMISYNQFCKLCDEWGIPHPPRPPQH